MWLFVGLGNPGREYNGTRHNIGFEVVDQLEQRLERSTGWRAGKGDFYFAKGFWKREEVLLVKPTTFMNLSGRAVRDAMQFYKIDQEKLIVIADDLAIAAGALRLRQRGSDGGHNGLGSIILETGTEDFARLRCGVGSEFRRGEQVRYVLSPFKPSEREAIDKMIESAIVACQIICEEGVEKAMNKVNVMLKVVPKNEPVVKKETAAKKAGEPSKEGAGEASKEGAGEASKYGASEAKSGSSKSQSR